VTNYIYPRNMITSNLLFYWKKTNLPNFGPTLINNTTRLMFLCLRVSHLVNYASKVRYGRPKLYVRLNFETWNVGFSVLEALHKIDDLLC
jgi:hypothetical protein